LSDINFIAILQATH